MVQIKMIFSDFKYSQTNFNSYPLDKRVLVLYVCALKKIAGDSIILKMTSKSSSCISCVSALFLYFS